jgi:hypothetical protein
VELYADGVDDGSSIREEMTRVRRPAGATDGYLSRTTVSAIRPATDYAVRMIPNGSGLAVPLEPFIFCGSGDMRMRERLLPDDMPETFFGRHAGCVRAALFDPHEGATQTKVIRLDTAQSRRNSRQRERA